VGVGWTGLAWAGLAELDQTGPGLLGMAGLRGLAKDLAKNNA